MTLALRAGGLGDVTEAHRHWVSDANVIASGNGDQWAEKTEPGAAEFAVFNHEPPRELSLHLDAERTWGGLIVDGEGLTLDLAGKTLNLTGHAPSTNDFNISVGGAFDGYSKLVLSNGAVVALEPVLVGRLPPNAEPGGALLELETGAHLEAPGIIVAGPDRTGASFYMENGATLKSQRLDLALGRGSEASVLVQGPGTRMVIDGATSALGREGRLEFYLQGGAAADWGDSLVTMEAGRGNRAQLWITDPGTASTGGAFRLGYNAGIFVGDEAVFRTPGMVTLTGGAFEVDNATAHLGHLEVAEGGGVFFSSDARVTITNAVVNNGDFVAYSRAIIKILKPLILSNSVLRIDRSIVEANELHIATGGRLRGTFGTLKSPNPVISKGSVFLWEGGRPYDILTIDADFNQTPDGVLEFLITTTNNGRLNILGNAQIDGLIKLSYEWAPSKGDVFTLVTAGGPITGSPAFEIQGLEPGWEYEVEFIGTNLIVRSLNDARRMRNLSGPSDYAINVELPDTDASTFTLLSLPEHGKITGEYPHLFYTSDPGFSGFDYIKYRNSVGLETTLQFTIEARPIPMKITQDGPELLTVEEGETARRSGTLTDAPGNGPVSLYVPIGQTVWDAASGTWTWVYNTTDGPDESLDFSIMVEDKSEAAFAPIRLLVLNAAPTAHPQTVTRFNNDPVSIELTASDPGNDSITYEIVRLPTQGILSGTLPFVTYLPNPNYTGPDSFMFKAVDSDGAESPAVEIQIADLRQGAEPLSIRIEGQRYTITFQGAPGLRYRIQTAPDLNLPLAWNTVGEAVNAPESGIFTFTETEPIPSQRFYRAVAE